MKLRAMRAGHFEQQDLARAIQQALAKPLFGTLIAILLRREMIDNLALV